MAVKKASQFRVQRNNRMKDYSRVDTRIDREWERVRGEWAEMVALMYPASVRVDVCVGRDLAGKVRQARTPNMGFSPRRLSTAARQRQYRQF